MESRDNAKERKSAKAKATYDGKEKNNLYCFLPAAVTVWLGKVESLPETAIDAGFRHRLVLQKSSAKKAKAGRLFKTPYAPILFP